MTSLHTNCSVYFLLVAYYSDSFLQAGMSSHLGISNTETRLKKLQFSLSGSFWMVAAVCSTTLPYCFLFYGLYYFLKRPHHLIHRGFKTDSWLACLFRATQQRMWRHTKEAHWFHLFVVFLNGGLVKMVGPRISFVISVIVILSVCVLLVFVPTEGLPKL